MDEADIENVDDLMELEARLYAQIHHEATDEPNVTKDINETNGGEIISAYATSGSVADERFEITSKANKNVSRRYWAGGQQNKQLQSDELPQQRLIYNRIQEQQKTEQQRNLSTDVNITALPSAPNNVCKADKKDKGQDNVQCKLSAEKSNMKINPVAEWMRRKKNNLNKKTNSNRHNINKTNSVNAAIDMKQSLFARQQQKLQKAKRIEEKKQKSKKGKNGSKIKPIEIIDLDSDDETNSSDVLVIPTEPVRVITIDDSDDDNSKNNLSITIENEENALDSTDVQMHSTTASFLRPQNISIQSSAPAEVGERRLENSSRCTSPCSIQSSDDFIGQTDRTRLLAGANRVADDEDLLLLTSDMNSLLAIPNILRPLGETSCLENEKTSSDICGMKPVPEENLEVSDSFDFARHKTINSQEQSEDYRVDQGQYRAFDVYESESDIMDSVYSKGAKKCTVIRHIDTSSDEVQDIGNCSQRSKRLRKRRTSSTNKDSPVVTKNGSTSSDNESNAVNDDNNALRTNIPFISRGVAVERYNQRKRSISSSSSRKNKQRRSTNIKIAADQTSDTEFIETLNNLVQGQDNDKSKEFLEESEESETENAPTARDIAEKILSQHNAPEKINKSAKEDMAVPEDILKELDKVFETIDQIDTPDASNGNLHDDTVKISDSSDSDRENHLKHKYVPNEKCDIIEYLPNTQQMKTHAENGSPIYNIIYVRGPRKPGGIGWNDEMRMFYNKSWNGEHFIISKILQRMNPDKSLWRIYSQDRFNIKLNKRLNMRCTNCYEFGHMRSRCKRPRKAIVCYMCGDSGHHEPRCPNTICLRCGNKTQVFTKSCNACLYQNRLTCPICKIRGHSLDFCPDKWRRYHSTTEGNSHLINDINYNPRKYCCICGASGHISDNCRSSVRFSEYPLISSSIKSHQKSYSDVLIKAPHNGIALNLMYKPYQEHKFNLVHLTSSDKYYGRFLKAVGMDYLFQRKRHMNSLTTERTDTIAKKAKRIAKQYEANPYLKAARSRQINVKPNGTPPNQVQEVTESSNTNQHNSEKLANDEIIVVEDRNDNEVELVSCTGDAEEMPKKMDLNIISKECNTTENYDESFKSPIKRTSSDIAAVPIPKSQTDSALLVDSDSNYSFSEHFDVALSSMSKTGLIEEPTLEATPHSQIRNGNNAEVTKSESNPRELEVLPDFIPLVDSTKDHNEEHCNNERSIIGISKRFVEAMSDDNETEENAINCRPLPDLPCEAKIYLTRFHTKYLLSPIGNAFLKKISQAHNLSARLDFTSVGHVLVLFGFRSNQDRFQKELLLKYRELEDEKNERELQSQLNVPKRTYVLIRFLRGSITQLMNNLGNVNQLLKRLQFLERQQTKSGLKSAEKVRKSLNMILVGQAGLQDGAMHLDKLLLNLKTLIHEISDDVAPPELRSEITNHYKVIFSAYRHENYQELVDIYNKLVSKNRMSQLNIDPILLGQKVLNTNFTEKQKQKLEQGRIPVAINENDTEAVKEIVPNIVNQKNIKPPKRKANSGDVNWSCSATTPTNKVKASTIRGLSEIDNSDSSLNVKEKIISNNTSSLASVKTKDTTTITTNKARQSSGVTNPTIGNKTCLFNENSKKQPHVIMPPPSSVTSEKPTIENVTDKWKSTYDSLLSEITSEKTFNDSKALSSKQPSMFWSRESKRYLENCIRLTQTRAQIVEKLKRVQHKSENGQLSYNDYLAVIKLHTALNGK